MPPKIEKIRGDVSRLTHLAHTVVYVDEHGTVKSIFTNTDPMISVIAIIGPVEVEGKRYKQALWAEIGIGRGTPYSQAKQRETYRVHRIWSRQPIKTWSAEEERTLLPTLLSLMQSITDEATKSWEGGTAWYASTKRDAKLLLMGKVFTVPSNMPYTSWRLLESDFKDRTKGHIRDFIELTRLNFSKLKYASYPDKRLKRLKVVKERAAILGEANYGPLVLEHIQNRLGKPGTKDRHLFDSLLHVFKIEPAAGKDAKLIELRQQFEGHKPEKIDIKVKTFDKKRERRIKQENSYPNGPPKYTHANGHLRIEVKISQRLARYVPPPPKQ